MRIAVKRSGYVLLEMLLSFVFSPRQQRVISIAEGIDSLVPGDLTEFRQQPLAPHRVRMVPSALLPLAEAAGITKRHCVLDRAHAIAVLEIIDGKVEFCM